MCPEKVVAMSAEPVVRMDRVSTVYEGERIPAIRDIDLVVERGDFVCITGPNGAGKTTILETINGILPCTSGTTTVLGMDVSRMGHAVRKRTGYVIQNFEIDPLAPFLCKNVVMSGRAGRIGLLRFPGQDDWDAVWSAMEKVGIRDFADRPVGKLSGGEFQKILLARAMAQEPELYLMDEPFANLDRKARAAVSDLISGLSGARSTVLMVSHEIGSIPRACTHIVVMDRGRVIEHGRRDEVLASKILEELLPGMEGCR
jgi:zinc/manganese transport system ATP-binding protein